MRLSTFLSALACCAFAQMAAAQTLTFTFDNEYSETIAIELYSQDRDHVWPGGEVLLIDPSEGEGSYTAACRPNELICFGAWTINQDRQWGVGIDQSMSCPDCCYRCNDITTDILELY